MNYKSYRHHYIPKYLIKGFTNEQNEVFIYDKHMGKILTNTRPPKSIMWEKDRNTMAIGDFKTSIIEDETYLNLDNFYKNAFEELRNTDLNEEGFSTQKTYLLHLFILNLHWRIPATDKFFDDLFNKLNMSGHKNSQALKKHQRTHMQLMTLNEVMKNNFNTMFKYKIVEFDSSCFILGDNPTLFEYTPRQLLDLDNLIYIFPICSNRGIIKSPLETSGVYKQRLESKHALLYNALIIDQSLRYVISGNKELLQQSVNLHVKLRDDKKIASFKSSLFNRIKF